MSTQAERNAYFDQRRMRTADFGPLGSISPVWPVVDPMDVVEMGERVTVGLVGENPPWDRPLTAETAPWVPAWKRTAPEASATIQTRIVVAGIAS